MAKLTVRTVSLLSAVVIDLVSIEGREAVIEFNAASGVGVNDCDAAKVLSAMIHAAHESFFPLAWIAAAGQREKWTWSH